MKTALRVNAIFSATSGIVLILFSSAIAALFGIRTPTVFWIVGIALLFFAATILYEIRKLNRARIIWIITQDLLWVIGSIYILIVNPFSISPAGNWIITSVAMIVLAMAIGQALALMRQAKTPSH